MVRWELVQLFFNCSATPTSVSNTHMNDWQDITIIIGKIICARWNTRILCNFVAILIVICCINCIQRQQICTHEQYSSPGLTWLPPMVAPKTRTNQMTLSKKTKAYILPTISVVDEFIVCSLIFYLYPPFSIFAQIIQSLAKTILISTTLL